MHQSIPAVPSAPPPPPPPTTLPTPGISIFFWKNFANSLGWGQISLSNAPRWDKSRRQMPHPPRDHPESHTAHDLRNHYNNVTHHYFQRCSVFYPCVYPPVVHLLFKMPLINNTPNCVHDSYFWCTI